MGETAIRQAGDGLAVRAIEVTVMVSNVRASTMSARAAAVANRAILIIEAGFVSDALS